MPIKKISKEGVKEASDMVENNIGNMVLNEVTKECDKVQEFECKYSSKVEEGCFVGLDNLVEKVRNMEISSLDQTPFILVETVKELVQVENVVTNDEKVRNDIKSSDALRSVGFETTKIKDEKYYSAHKKFDEMPIKKFSKEGVKEASDMVENNIGNMVLDEVTKECDKVQEFECKYSSKVEEGCFVGLDNLVEKVRNMEISSLDQTPFILVETVKELVKVENVVTNDEKVRNDIKSSDVLRSVGFETTKNQKAKVQLATVVESCVAVENLRFKSKEYEFKLLDFIKATKDHIEFVDLIYFLMPGSVTSVEETVRAMNYKIAPCSVFNWETNEWSALEITETCEAAKRHKVEIEYLPLYTNYGIGLTTRSPLASGILTGKFALKNYKNLENRSLGDDVLKKVRNLKPIADELNVPMSQLAIACRAEILMCHLLVMLQRSTRFKKI
ncbi:potassium channel beta subunit 1 [Artemisia annua]|uniref:Potassium channel beta subunit 1 n=1 Tax=Artemisia annua TaxID=35608 RepID=A0A2U1LJJ7_ARTAN|nr:potassium channel beta subunit 1 [Artemisia annua]